MNFDKKINTRSLNNDTLDYGEGISNITQNDFISKRIFSKSLLNISGELDEEFNEAVWESEENVKEEEIGRLYGRSTQIYDYDEGTYIHTCINISSENGYIY